MIETFKQCSFCDKIIGTNEPVLVCIVNEHKLYFCAEHATTVMKPMIINQQNSFGTEKAKKKEIRIKLR